MGSIQQQFNAFVGAFPSAPPTKSTESWVDYCALMVVQFGAWLGGARKRADFDDAGKWWAKRWVDPVNTALVVAKNSGTLNKNPAAAPVGAFHFWGGGKGHVGVDLTGGGTAVGMASTSVGTAKSRIGTSSVKKYGAWSGSPYLGWSANYRGGKMRLPADTPAPNPAPTAAPTVYKQVLAPREKGTTIYWPTGPVMRAIQQQLKNHGWYAGVVDGVGGPLTAKAVQRAAAKWGGYAGPIDGVFGVRTALAVQKLAKTRGGYSGPIDADPRENSWRGFLKALETTK